MAKAAQPTLQYNRFESFCAVANNTVIMHHLASLTRCGDATPELLVLATGGSSAKYQPRIVAGILCVQYCVGVLNVFTEHVFREELCVSIGDVRIYKRVHRG
jgi:hypothetical protein